MNFVSGTNIKNYMINDQLVDWLEYYYYDKPTEMKDEFTKFIIKKGNEFESKIIEEINNNIKVKTVASHFFEEAYIKTLKLMESGTPLIHSAYIQNKDLKLYGIADLLIRSDFLKVFTDYEYKHTCKESYHYVVLDIKWSTLNLTADKIHLVNSGRIPAYKGQLYIYNQCLKEMQKYEPKVGFLLGRRYVCNSIGERFDGPFDKIGVVNFEKKDCPLIDKINKGIKWVRKYKKEGRNWELYPPSNHNLYPNMKVDSGGWNGIKTEIAKELNEITLIWYCGIKQREKAFEKGVFSYTDPRCTPKLLNIKGQREKLISNILKINRQNVEKFKIFSRSEMKTFSNEMFVDFETFCDVIDFENDETEPLRKLNTIFLIGVYYENTYYSFVAKDLNESSELAIMEEFTEFVRSKNNPVLWYWHAENQIWDKSYSNQFDKNNEIFQYDFNWQDLKNIFIQNEIVIKDCFSYKLKEIVFCLNKHGLITVSNNSDYENGKDASLSALKLYLENEKKNEISPMKENENMKEIIKYNEFDCVSLFSILNFLKMIF